VKPSHNAIPAGGLGAAPGSTFIILLRGDAIAYPPRRPTRSQWFTANLTVRRV